MASDAVQVNVDMAIGRVELTCPVGVEKAEAFICTLEVYEGSDMNAAFDIDGGTLAWQTFIGCKWVYEELI